MIKHKLVYVPMVASALLVLGACDDGTPDAQYAGICVDPVSEVRLDDSACGDFDEFGHNGSGGGNYFMWISTGSNHTIPSRGAKVPQYIGTRTMNPGTPLAKGVPVQGGPMSSITRGGFGVKAGAVAGVGGKVSSGG